jgi:valyl-tRNA synthetase
VNYFLFKEYLKPVFTSEDETTKRTAQATLYRALEVGLRLLSPFMPFITEELYQRLPRPEEVRNNISSICVAPYPEIGECSWRNEIVEQEVEFIQKVAKAIRSARSDYNLPNKTKTEGKSRRKPNPWCY